MENTLSATAGLDDAIVRKLAENLRGNLIRPGDDTYETSRKVWNGMIDRHPLLIVQCAAPEDVVSAIHFAREQNVPVSVRCGGHNVGGTSICEGGIVIDLSRMNTVQVDQERQVVRVGGGAKLGDLDRETQKYGLAVPVGVVSRTGIAGLSLHGGLGLLTRKYGLTSDNLVGAEVVTADGRMLTVSEQSHPDLLWALRGGGGNFGVVTSFVFRLHPVGPEVWAAFVFYPVEKAPKVLRFFSDFITQAPDEIMGIGILWNAPTEEMIPEEHRGKPVVIVAACHCGSLAEGERALQPLREIATPVADLSGPMPFLNLQQMFDPDYPDGRRYYWKSTFLRHLNDEAAQALADHSARRPSALSSIDVWALGGAMGRVRPEATAFADRSSPFLLGIEANWEDPAMDEANIAWAREVFRDMQRFSPGGSYLNFPGFGEEGQDQISKSYGANYQRLQTIKAKYDPENFFRHNLNIQPADTPEAVA